MPLDLHEDVIAEAIVDVIKAQTETLRARMDWLADENAVLKAQIKALEDRPPLVGPQGEKGLPGDPGPPGAPGAPGESGPAGAAGPAGPPGSPGERGEVGPAGPQGIAGRDGLPGVPGQTGEKGIDGKDGARGPAGLDGQDGTLESATLKHVGDGTYQLLRKETGEPIAGDAIQVPHWTETFDAAKDYKLGALVKWGGTVYIAKSPGIGITPGTNGISESMWGIFSERGRQGKTGDKGLTGDQGPRGEKGDRGPERW